jgi:hypothetical protein
VRKSVILFGALCLTASFGSAAISKELRGSEAQAIQLLKDKGAVFGPVSPALKAAGSGRSSIGGATCHGAAKCLQLLDAIGDQCKSFTCNGDVDGKPSCFCDL